MGFEFQILDKLQTIHTPLLDRFMVAITKLGDAGIVWIILTVILLLIPKTRKSGVYMAVALIADLIICNVILKPIVARIRPYSINQTVQLLVTPLKDYSFPSGHTAASFASVSALYFAGRKRMKNNQIHLIYFYIIVVFKNVFIRSLSNGRFRRFDHWALMWMDCRYDHPKSYGKKIKEK